MKFLVIVGTAREKRKSIRPARALEKVLEESDHEVFFYDLREKEVPPIGNRTYVDEGPVPEDVQEYREYVLECDCVVPVVPEYNHSVPGIFKTLIDYLYPEYDDRLFAYVTVSGGGFGGVNALNHLHDITLEIGGIPGPSLPVSNVSSNFDGDSVSDEYSERLSDFVGDLEKFVEKRKIQ